MQAKRIAILLVQGNSQEASVTPQLLAEAAGRQWNVACVDRLSNAIEHLTHDESDLVLLSLFLPDCRGLDTFMTVHQFAPEIPIVVLVSRKDEALALRAVREGAQDYLIQGQTDAQTLAHAVQCAILRHKTQGLLRAATLTDDLTRLYNRRGFMAIAEYQLRLAHRIHAKLALFFLDLDGLKKINDTFGHGEGDVALLEAAETLRETFRESDIIARLGGDEFVVLVVNADQETTECLLTRVEESLRARNDRPGRRFRLSLSVGVSFYHPDRPCALEELLGRADALMLREKKCRREASLSAG